MRQAEPVRLAESEPLIGVTLFLNNRGWTVTGRSTYQNPEDLWTTEWSCEAGGETAYLLKEVDERKNIRWFFTHPVADDTVQLPDGETLEAWLGRTQEPQPPPSLVHRETTYRYETTSEGIHEEDSGERSEKVTWEYWDGAHAHNLAVERWPDGTFECFHGAYIDPARATFRAPSSARPGSPRGRGANPFLVAAVCVPAAYLLAFIVGQPLDSALAFALSVAGTVGWFVALARAPAAGGGAILFGLLAAAVFWQFPPLTSGAGVLTLFGTPAAVAWLARRRGAAERRPAVCYTAAFGVAGPLLILGLVHYFRFAPGPHTPEQYALALAPAGVGAIAGWLVAGLVFPASGEGAR